MRKEDRLTEPLATSCPYCGELVEVYFDEDGGSHQSFVEDCPVCCRPWEVEISHGPDGHWSVTLRTADD